MARATEVLILGGGYGGLMAAPRLARCKQVRVTLVDRHACFQQRIRWHQVLAGDQVADGDYQRWLQPAGVRFVQGDVVELDLTQRRVHMADGVSLAFDQLAYALGSQVIPETGKSVWQLSSKRQAETLQSRWSELASARARVLLVGGGLTQLETAAELAERYPKLRLQLVTRGEPFAAFHPRAKAHFEQHFARRGVEILSGIEVERFDNQHAWLANGVAVPFDVCIAATGFQVSPLAREAGLKVNHQGRIEVDEHLRSVSHPHVWAVGDAAAFSPAPDSLLRMSCATAMPLGAHVGENLAAALAGKPLEPFRFGYVFRCISLGRRDGVIQWTDHWDQPTHRVFTGRLAAQVKEWICKMTYYTPQWELKTGLKLYVWNKPPFNPVAKSLATHRQVTSLAE